MLLYQDVVIFIEQCVCVRACVRACVRVCVCVCVAWLPQALVCSFGHSPPKTKDESKIGHTSRRHILSESITWSPSVAETTKRLCDWSHQPARMSESFSFVSKTKRRICDWSHQLACCYSNPDTSLCSKDISTDLHMSQSKPLSLCYQYYKTYLRLLITARWQCVCQSRPLPLLPRRQNQSTTSVY